MPISSERYAPILDNDRPRGAFSIDDFRTALQGKELAGVLTDATPESVAALTRLVEQAQLHGLEATDFNHALSEIKDQLDIEASTVARHEHVAERAEVSKGWLNLASKIGVRWDSMLETFGRGKVAKRAHSQRQGRLQDRDHIEQVTQAAIERASLRKRYQEYIRLGDDGGEDFNATLQRYRTGEITRPDLEGSAAFQDGIENILKGLKYPDPFVLDQAADGTPIELPMTDENKAFIKNHLRFILQDEVIQLTQLSQMKVMETKAYQVDTGKPSVIAAKLLGSGTLWGMGIRTTGRLAIGGSIAMAGFAATPAGWAVIAAAFGAGAIAGAGSQWAQYKFQRRQQKKMDLAVGATQESVQLGEEQIEVAKSAEQINTTLRDGVANVQSIVTEIEAGVDRYADLQQVITATYKIMMDAECRLLASQQGKAKDRQDFISFGLDNRLQASLDLMHNLKQAALALRMAKETVLYQQFGGYRVDADFEQALQNTAVNAQTDIAHLKKNLETALVRGEGKRRLLGAALGGTFGGLAAVAMDYIHAWFADQPVTPAQPATFETSYVTTVHQHGQAFEVHPTAAGDPQPGLLIRAATGESQVVNLPAGVDPKQIVVTDDLHLFEAATGKPLGQVELALDPGVGEALKVPQLDANLTMSDPHIVSVEGKDYGLVLDNDGNLALYNVNPDTTIDLSQPLAPPQNVLTDDLHQEFDGLPDNLGDGLMDDATQLHVEVQDGTILVKSVYDQSVVAQFEVDPVTGSVTSIEPTPVSTTGDLLDRLYADPNSVTAQLLNKMGVQFGEIATDSEGHFVITDEVVKGEYLGNTEAWRQVRLELMLEAKQAGLLSTSEPADMVVARLERATRHLLMEANTYPDTYSALQEAFGKPAAFVQHNELPWINGPSSVVSNDWEKLVDAMRQLPDQTTTQPGGGVGAGAAAGGIEGGVHPITSDTLFETGAAGRLAGTLADAVPVNSALNRALEGSAYFVLAVAGLALEQQPQQLSHLRGADQAMTKQFGTRTDTYTFVQGPEKPTPVEPVDPAVAAEQEYNAVEADWEAGLQDLDNQLIGLRTNEWSNGDISLGKEIVLLDLADGLDRVVDQKEVDAAALLNEPVAGKPFASLAEYIAHVCERTAAARQELIDVVEQRTDRFVEYVESIDVAMIVADTDAASLTAALDSVRNNLGYGNLALQTLDFTFFAAPIRPRVVAANLKLVDAATRIEARLAELATAPPPVVDPLASLFGTPPEPPEDPAEARRRLAESAAAQAEAVMRDIVFDDYDRLDQIIAEKFRHQYLDKGHANVLAALATEMKRQGVFDRNHLVQLDNHLGDVPEMFGERLRRSTMMKASGDPDEFAIRGIITKLKAHPDISPFQ